MSTPTPAPAGKDAVAEKDAVAPKPDLGTVPGPDVCADCGIDKVVVCTDGVSATRRCFCALHRPANLPATV